MADHEQGLASGLVNTSIQIGGAIVVAVVTAVLGTGAPARGQLLPHMTTAVSVVAGVVLAGALLTVAVTATGRLRRPVGAAEAGSAADGGDVADAPGPVGQRVLCETC